MENNRQKKTYSKLIFPTSGKIMYEEIPKEEGECHDTGIYSYYDRNNDSSGIFIVRKTLKEARSVMLKSLKKDIENNKAEGIRLKAEYKKLKQWDITQGSIKK